jgi:hypothetical protein
MGTGNQRYYDDLATSRIVEMNKIVPPPTFPRLLLSSADSLSGYLDAGRSQTSFGPVGQAAGAAPPAFHQTRRIAAFKHSYGGDAPNQAFLQIDATNLVNTANSPGLGVDAISTQATSDLGSANIVLTDNALKDVSILGLAVSATLIHSESDASFVFGQTQGYLGGSASFGSLKIGGALIGKTLSFAGTPTANTILYQSASVTITLDKQTLSEFLPPSGLAPIGPNRITTDAIDISLNHAHLFGTTISGNFTLGETSASLFPPFHA